MRGRGKIGLGTVQFGVDYGISNKSGRTHPQEVTKILKLAKKEGIELLDSASGYGKAEEVLGENDLSGFNIVSKFLPPSKKEKIIDQFNLSLKNLKVKSLYGYLAHRPLVLLREPDQWEDLKSLKEQFLVEKIGFSLNEPEELDDLLKNGFVPDLVQVPFNYFDRRFESRMMDLKSIGCEIHTRSTFLQGLFFMDPTRIDSFFDEIKPLLKDLQINSVMLPGQLLNFVLDRSFVDKVIIGVENAEQLTVNLEEKKINKLQEMDFTISKNILVPSKWPKK